MKIVVDDGNVHFMDFGGKNYVISSEHLEDSQVVFDTMLFAINAFYVKERGYSPFGVAPRKEPDDDDTPYVGEDAERADTAYDQWLHDMGQGA